MIARVLWVTLALVACKKGGDAPPSPLQDGAAVAVVRDAAIVFEDAPAAKAKPVATQIAVGASSACAVLADGTVRCWGKNDHGQLGDGTRKDAITPVAPNVRGVKQLVMSDDVACALVDDTSVVCWGKLGYAASQPDLLTPTAVPGVRGARVFVIGDAGCATLADKTAELVCWGDVDPRGHIQTTGLRHAPTPVPGLDHVIALASRAALRDDGELVLWLEDGAPVKAGVAGMRELGEHAGLVCALDTAGETACFSAQACGVVKVVTPKPKPVVKPKPKPVVKPKPKPKKGAKPAKPAKPAPVVAAPEPPKPVESKPVAWPLPVPKAKHLAFSAGACVITTAKQLICADIAHKCAPARPWPAMNTVETMSGVCASLVNGTVRCGVTGAAAAPVIAGVTGTMQLAATATRGCAIDGAGAVTCWEGTAAAFPIVF